MDSQTTTGSGIGLDAFATLSAEHEPWLHRCHVPPPDFDYIAGAGSYLVLGERGSGKTALFQALKARLEPRQGAQEAPDHLVVYWQPSSSESGMAGSAAADKLFAQILRSCTASLIAHLTRWPREFEDAVPEAKLTLLSFIQEYRRAELDHTTVHIAQAPPEVHDFLDTLAAQHEPNEWLANAEPSQRIIEFMKALRAVGPKAVYILLDPDALGDSEEVLADLSDFLSCLPFFRKAGFEYKMILPTHLGQPLLDAGVVDRRRVGLSLLHWQTEDLLDIVIRRVELASGKSITGLEEICEDRTLVRWLERTGGHYPRGWLVGVRHLAAQFLRRDRRVTTKEWKEMRKSPRPPLIFDKANSVISVGWRHIDDVAEIPMALFAYLHQHSGRVCTRQELYYRAYRPLAYPDTPLEESREYPAEYDHILDSAMSRLRKAIEPDPRSPLYLITVRGRGYKLETL